MTNEFKSFYKTVGGEKEINATILQDWIHTEKDVTITVLTVMQNHYWTLENSGILKMLE